MFKIFIIKLFIVAFYVSSVKLQPTQSDDNVSLNHSHSYTFFYHSEIESIESYEDSSAEISNNSILKLFKHKEPLQTTSTRLFQDCNSLFEKCLCSFNEEIKRYFLYCNDPSLKKIPNFNEIYNLYDENFQDSKTDLIFSKLDFRGSFIRRLKKEDFNKIKFDFYKSKFSNIRPIKSNHSSFESFLDELKKTVLPIYHIDFENVIDIEDGSFEDFINRSLVLTHQLQSETNKIDTDELLLKIRFTNSNLILSSKRKPFRGLQALLLTLDNITNEFLVNSIFDNSIISEISIENSYNFIGFIDIGENLPNGKILNKFSVLRSYKIDSLCSHSLPSFVDQESFNEISIKKCPSLRSIKAFTFYKYRHLKNLILSSNNFNKIDKNGFRFLNQLEYLDLSFNPIVNLEDEVFKDLSSLKRLTIEHTPIRQIDQFTLKGLIGLQDLRISKSMNLSFIHEKAFEDSKKSLKEIQLKDTPIEVVKSIENGGSWLHGLDLVQLNLDSNTANQEFSMLNTDLDQQKVLMCKFLKVLSPNTLVSLQRNQTCSCLVYFLYSKKNYSYPKWEYKAPFCYRNQLKYFENGTKMFENIIEKEVSCGLLNLEYFCNPTTTTRTTTTSTTTTKSTRKITRYNLKNPTTTIPPKKTRYPRFNFAKFMQVFLVVAIISAISVFLTIIYLRITTKAERKKKLQKLSTRKRSNSNTSSIHTTSTANNLPRISSKTKLNRVVLPPNVMPPFSKSTPTMSSSKTSKQKSQIEYKQMRKNETRGLLNEQKASFSIGSGYD